MESLAGGYITPGCWQEKKVALCGPETARAASCWCSPSPGLDMKVFSLALLTLLLAALWTGSQSVSFRSPYSACCYKEMFIRKKIPDFLIRSYQNTPSHCSRRAVRVELLKGKKFCVDPEEGWFQKYRKQKESTRAST